MKSASSSTTSDKSVSAACVAERLNDGDYFSLPGRAAGEGRTPPVT